MNKWDERDKIIREMGYANYYAYLRSPLWRSIRVGVLERDRFKCRHCGERATEVHHLDYRRITLEGVARKSLVSLCHTCHTITEKAGIPVVKAVGFVPSPLPARPRESTEI